MSRAFVKEHEDDEERGPDRPIPPGPNYVTPRGLDLLEQALVEAETAGNEREAKYYRERVSTASVVDPASQKRDRVQFGASVTARDVAGKDLSVRIVGHDEADPLKGLISFESPVAQAMMDHRAGDTVTVVRPAGPIEYKIRSIAYE
ncbi:MAG TPA: GreA/GreB family elongation factor [Candidatus Baltobacteraceae bacterium]|jgi:transcription elongation GreA/GreB family factor